MPTRRPKLTAFQRAGVKANGVARRGGGLYKANGPKGGGMNIMPAPAPIRRTAKRK